MTKTTLYLALAFLVLSCADAPTGQSDAQDATPSDPSDRQDADPGDIPDVPDIGLEELPPPEQDTVGQDVEARPDPDPGEPLWGESTDPPQVFAASDVSQKTLDTTLKWFGVASDAWGNMGPLEIWIVGKSVEAVKELDAFWCDHRASMDPNWDTRWDCVNGDPYGSGIGWSPFYRYVEEGGAAVSVYRRSHLDYHFQIITLSAKYPGPDEQDYGPVTMHEYFHVVQHAHILDIQTGPSDAARGEKMGGKGKPWFAEGGAEYMGQLLHSRQPGMAPGHLKQRMQWKYTSVDAYKAYGKRLEELTYGDPVSAYDIGAWFIAYLIHNEGEETFLTAFYDDLDALGFEEAFTTHFGQSPKDYVDEFDLFLDQGIEDALAIIP